MTSLFNLPITPFTFNPEFNFAVGPYYPYGPEASFPLLNSTIPRLLNPQFNYPKQFQIYTFNLQL
jgi:hypothetical protein